MTTDSPNCHTRRLRFAENREYLPKDSAPLSISGRESNHSFASGDKTTWLYGALSTSSSPTNAPGVKTPDHGDADWGDIQGVRTRKLKEL